MKKGIIVLIGLFLLTGCGNKSEKVSCVIDKENAIFTLKKGIISSYKLGDVKISKPEIDEINGIYFKSSKNNKEGKKILENYVKSIGGSCNKEK